MESQRVASFRKAEDGEAPQGSPQKETAAPRPGLLVLPSTCGCWNQSCPALQSWLVPAGAVTPVARVTGGLSRKNYPGKEAFCVKSPSRDAAGAEMRPHFTFPPRHLQPLHLGCLFSFKRAPRLLLDSPPASRGAVEPTRRALPWLLGYIGSLEGLRIRSFTQRCHLTWLEAIRSSG